MDTDILKPDTGYLSIIERPTHTASASSSKGTSELVSSGSRSPPALSERYTEPVSEGEEDENIDLAPAKDEDKRTGLSGVEVAEAIAYREQMLKKRRQSEAAGAFDNARGLLEGVRETDEDEDAVEADDEGDADGRTAPSKTRGTTMPSSTKKIDGRTLSIDPLAPSSAFDETLRNRLRGERRAAQEANDIGSPVEEDEREHDDDDDDNANDNDNEEGPSHRTGDGRVLSRDWTAPAGKRISVPVRVEPKVYFAAERTFLVSVSPPSSKGKIC